MKSGVKKGIEEVESEAVIFGKKRDIAGTAVGDRDGTRLRNPRLI
jgi:hypothetical protein